MSSKQNVRYQLRAKQYSVVQKTLLLYFHVDHCRLNTRVTTQVSFSTDVGNVKTKQRSQYHYSGVSECGNFGTHHENGKLQY
jgi:hypothetical protein